jgi:hypothetical protein
MKLSRPYAASSTIAVEHLRALRFYVQNGAEIMTTERYNPNTKGWGVAALIVALAIIANVTAYSIHKATYLKPDKAPASAEQGR